MHTVIAHQVGIGFNRAQIIDGNHLDIGASRFDDGAKHVAAYATKPVDGNFNGHEHFSDL